MGDRVTETLYALGRTPDVQIVDGVERRKKREAPRVPFASLLKASNPAGTLTVESIRAVKSALAGRKPVRIMIDGEEDLLAIPAIEAAPLGSGVYYGQPGKGVVAVTVDDRAKSSVERMFAAMKAE